MNKYSIEMVIDECSAVTNVEADFFIITNDFVVFYTGDIHDDESWNKVACAYKPLGVFKED